MNVKTEDVMEIINREFNFDVQKLPLSGPDNLRTPYKGLFRSDTGACVGRTSVGADYQEHTRTQVAELVQAGMSLFSDEVELTCHFRDGHYVQIKPTLGQRHAVYGTADDISPVVMLRAGYDQRPVLYSLFGKRDACDNMLCFHTVAEASYRILHRKSLNFKVDQLLSDLSGLKQGWLGVKEVATRMESREVMLDEFLKKVYGEPTENSERSTTIHHNRVKAIMNRVISERRRTGRSEFGDREIGRYAVSGWEAYNAVQGFQQHDATRKSRSGNEVTRFDRVILAASDSYVQQAEVLALAG